MDYNISIPDIYSDNFIKKDDVNITKYEYILKPHEQMFITLRYYFLYFELNNTEDKNLYINDTKIWNRRILFSNKKTNICKILNFSDNIAKLIIYQYYIENQIINILPSHGYSQNNMEDITLISSYDNSSSIITDNIYIVTKQEIKVKIISIQSFNIKLYYKVKFISKNNNYEYLLGIFGIENTFNNMYLSIDTTIDSSINNLSDVIPKYSKIKFDIRNFLKNNHKYIFDNNIKLPEEYTDEDGWKNIFYHSLKTDIINKYSIDIINIFYTTLCI